MTAVRMDGTILAGRVREDVAREVAELGHVGLATVLVGDDPASHVYIAAKHKAATEAGIDARDIRLPVETSEQEVLDLVQRLNADDEIDGILVQLPLPPQIDETRVTYAVAPTQDVDGFHPVNAGNHHHRYQRDGYKSELPEHRRSRFGACSESFMGVIGRRGAVVESR